MSLRVLPSGERAVLFEVADLAAVHALAGAVQAAQAQGRLARVQDVVPASRTVLVTVAEESALAEVVAFAEQTEQTTRAERAQAEGVNRLGDHEGDGDVVVIDVRYDGPDLDDVARLTHMSTAEVIARHTGTTYTVDFLGFAPGFAYLSGLDPVLHVSRLDTPRTSVPAGAVAIAGDRAAVYPRSSPGGWRLLGRTDAVLFDVTADPPALLQAGARVQFREVC
ncbi:5-oxoprolinase subunit B family protein [Ruania halotolerans]|uniref:5-oxoprolinase subunit B family protein n=1 Tax=Ruania halotolerans TaxID=2897773 RepID=UPI001E2EA57A|nr:allophanate hydrolase subunit 1 [Ruania halotolerans]UFU07713.1 allophanate hydrolase subunit 1 [Ruania halotolerans]